MGSRKIESINSRTNKFFLFIFYFNKFKDFVSSRFWSRFAFKIFILGKYLGKKIFLGKILIFERYEARFYFRGKI